MFIELSPELAELSGIQHGGWVVVSTPRGEIEARAMITARLKPLTVQGRTIHQIGIPIHWGYSGEVVGDCANELTALVTEANVSMHEAKAFVCNVRAGRLNHRYPAKVKFVQSSTSAASRVVPESAQPEGRNAGEAQPSVPHDSKPGNRAS
jgi:formate dehydrogenase major subunit